MSTTMRYVRVVVQGERVSPRRRNRAAAIEQWAVAHAALTCVTLSAAYVVALMALVAVLATSTLFTFLGWGVMVVYAAMVLAMVAVAIYTLMPEGRVIH